MTKAMSTSQLFSASVIVTGTHYSMSTLVGQIIGLTPDFNLVHEPLNHQPTLGYATVPTDHWYEYFAASQSEALAQGLMDIQFGKHTPTLAAKRLIQARSLKDLARVAKFAKNGLTHCLYRKPAVFKDPFLCFSARHLQERYGMSIILTVRHPCGFAESLSRRGGGFDFMNLLQPALLDALPELANDIERFSYETQPITDQAALLWNVVYGFAMRYYLNDPNTYVVRQEDLASAPKVEVDRLLFALGSERHAKLDNFLEENLNGSVSVDFAEKGTSYVQRNAQKTAIKWKSRLTQDEIEAVMLRVEKIAERYGYTRDGMSEQRAT